MEIKELKCELAQEQKEKIKYLKKDLKKNSRNDNRKEASTQTKCFDCEFRAQAFTSDRDLESHMITMHRETSESYSQTPDLKEKFVQCSCVYCGKSFNSKGDVSQHHGNCANSSKVITLANQHRKVEPKKEDE
jgi:hypothetical protein